MPPKCLQRESFNIREQYLSRALHPQKVSHPVSGDAPLLKFIHIISHATFFQRSQKSAVKKKEKNASNSAFVPAQLWMLHEFQQYLCHELTPTSSSLCISCECPKRRLFSIGSIKVRYTMYSRRRPKMDRYIMMVAYVIQDSTSVYAT